MRDKLRIQVEKLLVDIRNRRRLYKAIGGMSVIVVFCIIYALTKPAITMERESTYGPFCQTEDIVSHEHDDSCYDEAGELICGYADFVVHMHDDSCYDEEGGLVCLLEEIEEHQHTDLCYKEIRTLVCEEKSGHVHTDACYEEVPAETTDTIPDATPFNAVRSDGGTVRVLVCGQEESENAHSHDDSCYEENLKLVCDEPEVVLHTHDDSCYDEEDNLICGKMEVLEHVHSEECFIERQDAVYYCGLEEHTHDDLCYDEEGVLICGLEEHIHSELCLTENALLSLDLIASGTFGEDMAWAVEEDESGDYVLRISGNGPIPDYTAAGNTPWYNYNRTVKRIVLEDGVSRAGNLAFQSFSAVISLTLPDSLEEIGSSSFNGLGKLLEVEIPGSVKIIGSKAFGGCGLRTVIFSEGLEKLEDNAFWYCSDLEGEIALPASLNTMGADVFVTSTNIVAYSVPETSESFASEDGVLYNKDKTTLLLCPKGKSGAYIIPDTVVNIADSAFNGCNKLTSIDIPESVKKVGKSAFAGCRGLRELTLPQLDELGQYSINGCLRLSKVTIGGIKNGSLPGVFSGSFLSELYILDNSVKQIGWGAFSKCLGLNQDIMKDWDQLTTIASYAFSGCTGLTEITIPKNVTVISSKAFENCSNLKLIHMNAADCTKVDSGTFINCAPHFTVEIGEDVDVLRSAFLTDVVKGGCGKLEFKGPNQLTVEEVTGGLALAYPLNSISGSCYVDEQGVLYQILEDGSAVLAYCPSDVTEYKVPAGITLTDGTVCTVTGVGTYAFNQAAQLTALTFEEPGNITGLADNAFANAVNLASINGVVTEEEAWALFTNCSARGFHVFYRTKLSGETGEGTQTGDTILISGGNEVTMSIQTSAASQLGKGEDGTFRYYTGESVTSTVAVSNPGGASDSGIVMRIYAEFSDFNGGLNNKPGDIITVSGNDEYKVELIASDTPDIVYYEFGMPSPGDTLSFPFQSSYPSPGSEGGSARIWGVIMTQEEAGKLGNGVSEIGLYHKITWETKADSFPVSKYVSGPPSLIGTGTADGLITVADLRYGIPFSRAGDTLEGIGKDLMKQADFEDVFTFPEGIDWRPGLVDAVRAGNWWYDNGSTTGSSFVYIEIDGVDYLLFELRKLAGKLDKMWVTADDGGVVKLCWSLYNYSKDVDMATSEAGLYIGSEVVGVIDQSLLSSDNIINNKVTATEYFTYSGNRKVENSCENKVSIREGSVTLKKEATDVRYWGEDVTYTITMENPNAMNYMQLGTLNDTLNPDLYIKPENMEAMFGDTETGKKLAIQIENAQLCTPVTRSVTAVDGTSNLTLSAQSTGTGTPYHGCEESDSCQGTAQVRLTLRWNQVESGLELEVDRKDGTPVSTIPVSGSIQEALDEVGFVVTGSSQYLVEWTYGTMDVTYPLYGGQKIIHTVPATVKSTLMQLGKDWPAQHPMESYTYTNTAKVSKRDGTLAVNSNTITQTAGRELYFDKSVSMDGKQLSSGFTAKEGDVLDYQLSITHRGSGIEEVLPLVDRLYGGQVLLAFTADNIGAAWEAETTRVSIKDQEYFKFEKPGSYRNVWLGGSLADQVVVEKTSEGLSTLIKWYYAGFGGARSEQVGYRAVVVEPEMTGGASSGYYTIGNEAWLGDHQTHRLYDSIGGGGTIIKFEKKILESQGDTPVLDVQDEDDYTLIREGNQVTYRLMLENRADYPVTLSHDQIYDLLPGRTGDFHQWVKNGNVSVAYKQEGPSEITVTGGDDWSVGHTAPGNTQEDPDWQYLCWGDTFSVNYQGMGTLYIYVTLTFPAGNDWNRYCEENGSTRLVNTLYVYHMSSSVRHDLVDPPKVLLQKGVYETGQSRGSAGYNSTGNIYGRHYYVNKDIYERTVTYYTVLYNGGRTNLYLNELQDQLPKGFTLHHLVNVARDYYGGTGTVGAADSSREITLESAEDKPYRLAEIRDMDGREATYKAARVSAATEEDTVSGRQKVTFTLSGGDLKYDDAVSKYYLLPGEAVVFGYTCYTGDSAGSEDAAVNRIAMPFYDALDSGVEVDGTSEANASDNNSLPSNDGGCEILDRVQASSYGFTDAANSQQWISSDVKVMRGDIVPGITKVAESVTKANGNTEPYSVSAIPTDIINWKMTASNSGNLPILDYQFTDTMKAPYIFTGKVGYETYDYRDNLYGSGSTDANKYLFNILGYSKDEGREVFEVQGNKGAVHELIVGGDPVTLITEWSKDTVEIELRMKRDDIGNIVMTVRFADSKMSIPEQGKGILTLSTANIIKPLEYQNTVYLNQVLLTPNVQTYDKIGQGNWERGDQGEILGVRNSAPVTIATGYATSSEKRVAAKTNMANAAGSTGTPNYIILDDETGLITYTLTVSNITERPMTKLIMIDNLPETGDHNTFISTDDRDSEFKVSLAKEPNVTVTVKGKDGEQQLTPDQYKIEYTTKTEFTSGDWNGAVDSSWSDVLTETARSLRLFIDDSSGTVIPVGAEISLSFDAVADEPSGHAGQTAWNSFGYHYGLKDVIGTELEAAPLKVGVKFPSVPKLEKSLVDTAEGPFPAEQDEVFEFILYTGMAVDGIEDMSMGELAAALAGRTCTYVKLPVKEGETAGSYVLDGLKQCRYDENSAGWQETDVDWLWANGTVYTVAEISMGSDYNYGSINDRTSRSYTFTYDNADQLNLKCINIRKDWSILLQKADAAHPDTFLSGAVFGLYSPKMADQMSDDDYGKLTLKTPPEREIVEAEITYYLSETAVSGADGIIIWSGLGQSSYLVKELRAPDGYYLDAGNHVLTRPGVDGGNLIQTITVENTTQTELPMAGGRGSRRIYLAGLLCLAAAVLLYKKGEKQGNNGDNYMGEQ